MTEIRIHNPIERGFAMVPDVLWQWPGLSFRAKSFMAFLLSFRGGVIPPVAAIEAATGLGRDVRRAIMGELQAAKLAEWHVRHDARGRVVAKFLLVDTSPLLRAVADGFVPGAADRAPEKPSDGKSGGSRLKWRRSPPEKSGDIVERETESAAPALHRAEAQHLSVAQDEKHAREAEGVAPGEASQEAERQESGSGQRADALAKADAAARLGLRVRCPDLGEWQSAASWLAKRACAGEALAGAGS